MTLEVRQLVLRAHLRDREDDEDEFDADELDGEEDEDGEGPARASRRRARSKAQGPGGCGGADDPCEDKSALKEEILAACQVWLREQLRHLNER